MFYLLGISNNYVPGHLARRDDRSHRSSRYACAYSLVATSATDRSPSGLIIVKGCPEFHGAPKLVEKAVATEPNDISPAHRDAERLQAVLKRIRGWIKSHCGVYRE
jgi:hypothetical protein